MSTIGQRIREARKAKQMTQADLAKKVGLSQGAIGHLEAGRNDNSMHLVQIAAALGVRAEWLTNGRGESFLAWPFDDVPPEVYYQLPQEDKDEIAAIVRFKVARIAKAKTA